MKYSPGTWKVEERLSERMWGHHDPGVRGRLLHRI